MLFRVQRSRLQRLVVEGFGSGVAFLLWVCRFWV